MNSIKSYKDLIVWQKSIDLVTDTYKLINQIPKVEEYSLSAQMRRSAVSIPSNIAEGTGRYYSKEYCRFLQISRGSLYELQTQITIAQNLGYITDFGLIKQIETKAAEVERMLNKMIATLNNSNQSAPEKTLDAEQQDSQR